MNIIVTNCARQGDVLVLRRDSIPAIATEKPHDPRGVVLAEGEVTGHHHRIKDPGVCALRAEGVHWDMLRVTDGIIGRLQHEEHAEIAIGAGAYEVRIQREYDWASEASRAVAD